MQKLELTIPAETICPKYLARDTEEGKYPYHLLKTIFLPHLSEKYDKKESPKKEDEKRKKNYFLELAYTCNITGEMYCLDCKLNKEEKESLNLILRAEAQK